MDRDLLFAIAEDEEREGSIPKDDIVASIRSDDTELAGVIYDIVTTDKLRKRIEPPLADNLDANQVWRCLGSPSLHLGRLGERGRKL